MSEFFRPYEGIKPYIFVSYSHKDSNRVLDIVCPLHVQKYRVWYDEGIPAGCDWPDNIASHMLNAATVLFFISASSLASINCFNEIKEALQQQKPVLSLRLDDTPILPKSEWEPLIEKTTHLHYKVESGEKIDQVILEHGKISPDFLGDGTSDKKKTVTGQRFNIWMLATIAGVLLLTGTAVGTYGLTNHWFDDYLRIAQPTAVVAAVTPVPTATPTAVPTIDLQGPWATMLSDYATFPDEQQERAVRAALNQPDGDVLQSDLLKITQLHFCGNMTLKTNDGIRFDENGTCTVNSAPVIQGSIEDLSPISGMLALERLSLVCQRIDSLDQLALLERLTVLNVAGNPIEIIGNLSGMVSLQTLHLEHTNVRDLSGLTGLQRLKTVTVSAEMFPLNLDAATQKFDVMLTR